MNYRTLRLKIITGYAILAIVLVLAAQMVYDSTRSLTALNTASERLMERRNIVDSLVYSMLDGQRRTLGDDGRHPTVEPLRLVDN